MKKLCKRFGIIAVVAVVGFSMTGCPTDGNDNGGRGDGFLGGTLNLGGQVWTMDSNWDTGETIWEQFRGNRAVSSEFGGSGAVTNGQLSFTIGTPSYLERWGDDAISDPDVMVAMLWGLETPNGGLSRHWWPDMPSVGRWIEIENVLYVFVDRDVTITTAAYEDEWMDSGLLIIVREEATTHTVIFSTNTGEPNFPVRWILWEWNGYYKNIERSGRALPSRSCPLRLRMHQQQ